MSKRSLCVTVLLFLFVASAVFAQTGLTIGWKLGGSLAWNYDNSIQTAFDSDAKMVEKQFGWVLGLFASPPFRSRDALQAELLVVQNSTRSKVAENHYQSWQLTYVDLPVLYQKTVRQGEQGCRGYLYAGPVFGLLIDSRYTNEIGGMIEEHDIEDANLFDLGLILGFGRISSEGITLDLRYQLGLLNVGEGDVKNDVLACHLGFVIR